MIEKQKNKELRRYSSNSISKHSKILFVVLAIAMMSMFTVTCFAADPVGGTNMWTKATEIMKDVYGQVVAISTIAAVVTAAIALLLMNFSKNGRTVDESRAWLKRIIISWAILNGLGFIMAYITPFFSGGQWTA